MFNEDSESAFPHGVGELREDGMTLRDYFAAKAIPQAYEMFNRGSYDQQQAWSGCEDTGFIVIRDTPNGIATLAYAIADAMLKARKV